MSGCPDDVWYEYVGEPLCTPTFGRDVPPGHAWCIRGNHVMNLEDFIAAKPCPGHKEVK